MTVKWLFLILVAVVTIYYFGLKEGLGTIAVYVGAYFFGRADQARKEIESHE